MDRTHSNHNQDLLNYWDTHSEVLELYEEIADSHEDGSFSAFTDDELMTFIEFTESKLQSLIVDGIHHRRETELLILANSELLTRIAYALRPR